MSGSRSLDLHLKTWNEALTDFVGFYNAALRQADGKPTGRLDIVHGYGSTGTGGVLRDRLRGFLQRHSELLEFTPGEYVDGNPGHTLVDPRRPLPDTLDQLEELICAYCTSPRSIAKITGEFRRYGNPAVRQAIRKLETQKRLRLVKKGAHNLYHAV